jgi:hypothetical protein
MFYQIYAGEQFVFDINIFKHRLYNQICALDCFHNIHCSFQVAQSICYKLLCLFWTFLEVKYMYMYIYRNWISILWICFVS